MAIRIVGVVRTVRIVLVVCIGGIATIVGVVRAVRIVGVVMIAGVIGFVGAGWAIPTNGPYGP